MSHQGNPVLAIGGEAPYGGETPYGGHSISGIGGFVMGTDLRSPMSTAGWYHEPPAVQAQPTMPVMSMPGPEATPKDPGQKTQTLMEDRNMVSHPTHPPPHTHTNTQAHASMHMLTHIFELC